MYIERAKVISENPIPGLVQKDIWDTLWKQVRLLRTVIELETAQLFNLKAKFEHTGETG